MSERNRNLSATEDRGRIWRLFLSGTQAEQPEIYRLASPLVHLDSLDPPCWFMSGENDDASTRAVEFRQQASKLGVVTGVTVVEGAPHPFLSQQKWFDQMVDTADVFFDEHLGRQ
jgi:acetyl esterase/lipase